MKYLFVLLFITVFIVFDESTGYTTTSPVWTHFTFQFQHANIIHLIINSLAFIGMFRILERVINKYILAATILVIPFTVSFMAMYEIPTVGISGAIYAMFGIYLAMITSKKLIIKDKNKLYIFVISIIICLIVSFLKPGSNFPLHLFSLIMGYMIWLIVELCYLVNK